MIPKEVSALFDFIDYLDNNKNEYIEKYISLVHELEKLDFQRNELNPDNNYKDKQQYDTIQNQIREKFEPINENICNPILNKLQELKIWSGDKVYASIWGNSISAISNLKQNFTTEDVELISQYKQKYLNFRTETNTDFFCLSFVFRRLDEILKVLFDFFKNTNENEFENFETKTIKVNSIEECVENFIQSKGKNVKYSIPKDFLYEDKKATKTEIKNEIIMGDKIQVDNISNNNGQIAIGKENTIETNNKNEFAKKSFAWQKWGIIIATILAIIVIAVTIIYSK